MLPKSIPVLPRPRWVSDSRSPELPKGTAGNLGLSPSGCRRPSLIHTPTPPSPPKTHLPTPAKTDTPWAVPHRYGDREAAGQPGPLGKGPSAGQPPPVRPGPERERGCRRLSLPQGEEEKEKKSRRGAEPAALLPFPLSAPCPGKHPEDVSAVPLTAGGKPPDSTCPEANCRRVSPKPCPPKYPALPAGAGTFEDRRRPAPARLQLEAARNGSGSPPRLGSFHTRKWRPNGELEPKFVRKARGMLGREGAGLPRV